MELLSQPLGRAAKCFSIFVQMWPFLVQLADDAFISRTNTRSHSRACAHCAGADGTRALACIKMLSFSL